MRTYIIVAMLMILAACNERDIAPVTTLETGTFEATVIGVEDCNMILLEFLKEDLDAVQEITDLESDRYFAVNLKKVLLQPGQTLIVEIRKLKDDEAFPCPTFAPTYPGLFLISYQLKS